MLRVCWHARINRVLCVGSIYLWRPCVLLPFCCTDHGNIHNVSVQYRIKGEVECSDGSEIKVRCASIQIHPFVHFNPWIDIAWPQHKQKFILYERLVSSIEPQVREQRSNIYVCCCLNRGRLLFQSNSLSASCFVDSWPGESGSISLINFIRCLLCMFAYHWSGSVAVYVVSPLHGSFSKTH